MQKPVEKPIKFIKNLSTKGKSYPITHVSAVIDDNGESVKSTIDSLKNKKVTWLELKNKRDAGKLIPGSLYRITDYNCTTTQENTRSAGHQFDIVLLALSADKLAEEGWAMEHPTDVYDVTFDDGVTLKCYLYNFDAYNNYNIVRVDNHIGIHFIPLDSLTIDEENKTVITDGVSSTDLEQEDLTYNYFQNSNLSAWKVWYCLDNDKSRFAWADNNVDESVPAFITSINKEDGIHTYYRDSADDANKLFAWKEGDSEPLYTVSPTPSTGDTIYFVDGELTKETVNSYTPAHEGTGLPNGRGVIYRLIDEWNNDCPYDFKNIVIYLGGKIEKGYLFSRDDGDIFSDMSLTGIFNDIIVKKTINDNNCQVIDIGIFATNGVGYCNVIVASGALSEKGVNTLSSNVIFGYTII